MRKMHNRPKKSSTHCSHYHRLNPLNIRPVVHPLTTTKRLEYNSIQNKRIENSISSPLYFFNKLSIEKIIYNYILRKQQRIEFHVRAQNLQHRLRFSPSSSLAFFLMKMENDFHYPPPSPNPGRGSWRSNGESATPFHFPQCDARVFPRTLAHRRTPTRGGWKLARCVCVGS